MGPTGLVRKSSSALNLLRERNKETGKISVNPWLHLQTRAETAEGQQAHHKLRWKADGQRQVLFKLKSLLSSEPHKVFSSLPRLSQNINSW